MNIRHCKAYVNNKWEDAVLPFKPAANGKILVEFRNKKRTWLPCNKVQIKKRNGMRAPRSKWNFTEKYTTKRRGRFRRVSIKPIVFDPDDICTNFSHLINCGDVSNAFAFNDNFTQWSQAIYKHPLCHPPGGGNAIIRPRQLDGFAFGIPTGFSSLEQNVLATQLVLHAGICEITDVNDSSTSQMVTARTILNAAFDRALLHMYKNPEKNVYHYSADPNDPKKKRLGLAIYAACTGPDVVDYITLCFDKLPIAFSILRNTGKSIYSDRELIASDS